MHIVIVGAGAQGAPCTAILARQSQVSRIVLGTSKRSAAEAVRDRVGSDKVVAAQLDAKIRKRSRARSARPSARRPSSST